MVLVPYHIISTPNSGSGSPDPLDLALLVLLLAGISYLTYELVERKVTTRRRLVPPSAIIGAAVIGLIISFAVLPAIYSVPMSPELSVVVIPLGAGASSSIQGFQPYNVTVLIGLNNTVGWQNLDSTNHTAHSDTSYFYSGIIPPNYTNKYTFTQVGTYPYHCDPHPWMIGVIIVKNR